MSTAYILVHTTYTQFKTFHSSHSMFSHASIQGNVMILFSPWADPARGPRGGRVLPPSPGMAKTPTGKNYKYYKNLKNNIQITRPITFVNRDRNG